MGLGDTFARCEYLCAPLCVSVEPLANSILCYFMFFQAFALAIWALVANSVYRGCYRSTAFRIDALVIYSKKPGFLAYSP